MDDKEKQQAERIANMLSSFVKQSSEAIIETGDMCFDIAFNVGDVRYRMSLAKEPDENTSYLKEN